ncbi:hypothetical protein ACIBL5_27805 [Streptomyces sp. NPDC050516]
MRGIGRPDRRLLWHGCPEHATRAKANAEWWRQKLDRNMERDQETNA